MGIPMGVPVGIPMGIPMGVPMGIPWASPWASPWVYPWVYHAVAARCRRETEYRINCAAHMGLYVGVRGFPYGIFDPCTPWGWGLDGLGKFVRRRRRRRPLGGDVRAIVASDYKTCIRL